MSTDLRHAQFWCDRIWGEREGFFCYAFGVGGHVDQNGKYRHAHWQQRFGEWSKDRDRFLAEAIERAKEDDVYVAPYLRSVPDRKKGSALPSNYLIGDIDGNGVAGWEKVLLGPGSLLVKSGPVGFHPYLRVPEDLKPDQLEHWNRRLAHTLRADHGWSENKVLRLPGTLNHKSRARGGEPTPVRLLRFEPAPKDWSLDELGALLPETPGPKNDATIKATSTTTPPMIAPSELLARGFESRHGHAIRALYSGDRQGYLSHSEADLALVGLLAFWLGPDRAAIDEAFRGSGLMRPKWDSARGETTYGRATIETALSGRTEFYQPPSHDPKAAASDRDRHDDRLKAKETGRIKWQPLSQVEMRSITWVDKPLLQGAAFHLEVGRSGVGKGTLNSDIAARITTGVLGPKRNVVWIGSEDSLAIDIKPRIVAAGGDPERVFVVESGWVQLPRDIPEISETMTQVGDVGVLVIDPVGNHISGRDSNSETDIRDAIAPLNALADDHDCMIIGVRHLSEKECRQGILAAILGSSAWIQVPRAVLAVVRDDEEPSIAHVQCVAGNRLPPGTPGRMFRLEGVLVPGLESEVTRAVWLGDSTKDVEEMISNSGAREMSNSGRARELILDILEKDGDQESDQLDARVANEIGISAKTVRNLRVQLKDAGLTKSIPEKDETGVVQRWFVGRTQAPRGGTR